MIGDLKALRSRALLKLGSSSKSKDLYSRNLSNVKRSLDSKDQPRVVKGKAKLKGERVERRAKPKGSGIERSVE